MIQQQRCWIYCAIITMAILSTTTSNMMLNKPYKKSVNEKRPNLLIFLVDDMGYGDVGVYNNNNRERSLRSISNTPNMDSFSKEGMMFTDYHSPYSVCTPSRAAMLTGRLGGRTGVYK